MSGYAATARIQGAAPRLVGAGRDPWAGTIPIADAPAGLVELEPGVGDHLSPPPPTLAERWDAARERWSQLTFYLFSAESWR